MIYLYMKTRNLSHLCNKGKSSSPVLPIFRGIGNRKNCHKASRSTGTHSHAQDEEGQQPRGWLNKCTAVVPHVQQWWDRSAQEELTLTQWTPLLEEALRAIGPRVWAERIQCLQKVDLVYRNDSKTRFAASDGKNSREPKQMRCILQSGPPL